MLKANFIKHPAHKILFILGLAWVLAGCSEHISGQVEAFVSKAPVTGATCYLRRADTNALLAGPKTSVNGNVVFGNVAFAGVGYITCSGGTYTDEATGELIDAPTLRSAKGFKAGGEFVVTPLTEIAVAKSMVLPGGIDANIEAMNKLVAEDFGIASVDIVSVKPTDINISVAQNNAAGGYATVLAGFSQYSANSEDSISSVINTLSAKENITNGSFSTALNDLGKNNPQLANHVNPDVVSVIKSGLDEEEIQDATPTKTVISSTVDVFISKGPITGAECGLYRAATNELLAGPIATVDGVASFERVAFSGMAYVKCTGGKYTDEATGTLISAANLTLRAGKRISGVTTFVVTPLTEIAMAKASAAPEGVVANIEAYNDSVADAFGLGAIDIVSVKPTDVNVNPVRDNASGWYGTVLAAISQYDLVDARDIGGIVHALTEKESIAQALSHELNSLSYNSRLADKIHLDVVNAIVDGLDENPDSVPVEMNAD